MVPVVMQVVVTGTMTGTTLTYTIRCIVPESPWEEESHDEDEDESTSQYEDDDDEEEDDEESLSYATAWLPALGV
jgi:uncharacterized metal-binding protein YceD (DUF177 family)